MYGSLKILNKSKKKSKWKLELKKEEKCHLSKMKSALLIAYLHDPRSSSQEYFFLNDCPLAADEENANLLWRRILSENFKEYDIVVKNVKAN